MASRTMRLATVAATFPGLAGCRVTVQNRYSVFGFNEFGTESPDQARTWSFLALAALCLVSAATGAGGVWLALRRRRRPSAEGNGTPGIPPEGLPGQTHSPPADPGVGRSGTPG